MDTVTNNDLKRVEDKIDRCADNVDKLSDKIDKLTETVTQLAIGQAELKGDLRGDIKTLNETVKGLDKRVEKIENSQSDMIKDVSDLKGAKSLIIPIIVAVTTSLLTLLIRAIPNP